MHYWKDYWLPVSLTLLFVGLVIKFFWAWHVHGIPLGFDPGIYRYLFARHATGWPPFSIGSMAPWAQSHPLGLFIFTSPLIKLGVPVDWFVGWIWNVVPIVLAACLAYVWWKKTSQAAVAIAVLLVALLSAPFYDGFVGMYWKSYAALFWMVATFYLAERQSWWALLTGLLVLVTHHQTGLLFALCLGTWWLLHVRSQWRQPRFKQITLGAVAIIAVALIAYIPVWHEAIWVHVQPLLTQWGSGTTPAGSFPTRGFYVQYEGVILLLGVYGAWLAFRDTKQLSLWHLTALWAGVFVLTKFFFYQRFFLHLDFFLLPFAAVALVKLWNSTKIPGIRITLCIALCGQAWLSYQVLSQRLPDIDKQTFADVVHAQTYVPENTTVITLENRSTAWFLGWLPHHYSVAGPGLFDLAWTYQDWEQFIYGSSADRKRLLPSLHHPVYFYAGPLFYQHYGDQGREFLKDPCLKAVPDTPMYLAICTR